MGHFLSIFLRKSLMLGNIWMDLEFSVRKHMYKKTEKQPLTKDTMLEFVQSNVIWIQF